MKKLILASTFMALVAACATTPPAMPVYPAGSAPAGGTPPGGQVADAAPELVKDLGHEGGPSVTIQLYAPKAEGRTAGYRLRSNDAKCWSLDDIFQYDVTLKNALDGAVLTSFTVPCKGGRARIVLQHLKPGLKYALFVVAKGNVGGTAADVVLNAKKAAVGYFDLTQVDPLAKNQELSSAIQVEMDCEGTGGYERTGRIDIVPVVRGGNATWAPESGQGECYICGDFPISAGTTTYDSMFHGGTNGDVFNENPFHNHWTNEINGWGWVQRDLPFAYPISRIKIGQAENDARYGTLTELYVKLRTQSGNWITVDSKYNQNLAGYVLRLPTPIMATAFRLELKSANGWVSAAAITLKADTGVPCPSTPPGSPAPSTSPCFTPSPSAPPTASPTASPTVTPTPGASPTASPTATPTPTPSPPCAGPFATFTQGGWGAEGTGSNPGTFRDTHWQAMTGGTLSLGTGRTLTFTSAAAVDAFLPAGGTAAMLDGSFTNPTTGGANVLASQLLALKLNVLRSDAGLNPTGATGVLRNIKFASGRFQGQTIGSFLALAERALGGDAWALPGGATLDDAVDAAARVNEDFLDPGALPTGLFTCP